MWRYSIPQMSFTGLNGSDLRFTRQDQIWYFSIAGSSAAILLIGRLLRPSAEGVGTHQQLGLPPCAFLHLTGIPCPSCGLTTSVAHAAHLHFTQSIVTQPFGFIVFVFALLSIPFSIYFINRRIPLSALADLPGRKFAAGLMLALFLLSWFYKIAAIKSLIPHI
jgi:hypothetical protein